MLDCTLEDKPHFVFAAVNADTLDALAHMDGG